MNSNKLEDVTINVKIKLAALWTSVLFLFIYADYFGLYNPGFITGLTQGKIADFQITPSYGFPVPNIEA
ncbi:MAG: hypothetical protein ACXACK_03145 [Candidatus Hodarchaeales archaeon]